jgi:hypothetical protein
MSRSKVATPLLTCPLLLIHPAAEKAHSRKFKVHDGKKGVGLSESGHARYKEIRGVFFLFWRLLYYAQLLQHAEFVRLLPHFHDLATFDPEEVKTRYRYRPTSRGNAHQLPLLGAP